ncbi:hypothetical protein [Scytonema sp. NUACC21]
MRSGAPLKEVDGTFSLTESSGSWQIVPHLQRELLHTLMQRGRRAKKSI